MKICEIINEDLKSNLFKLGLASAVGIGTTGYDKINYPNPPSHPPLSNMEILEQTALRAGIRGKELAHFVSQAAHETLDFSKMKEMGSDSYITKKYDIRYNPVKAKALGNVKPGDGLKYKGRGYFQITGRYNYRKAGEALGLPLEKHPEILERPVIAAKAAVWYWTTRVQPKIGKVPTVSNVTQKINPNSKSVKQRQAKFKQYDTDRYK